MTRDVIVEERPIGPVVFPAPDSETDVVILYLHGDPTGPEAVLDTARELALLTRSTVVCPRYRPTFPGALIDAHSAYSYCQAAGPIVVLGERLGAALAGAMLVQLRDSGAPMPRCAVLVSALLDLSLQTKSLHFNASTDPALTPTALGRRVADYARDTPRTDPRLSPLYANLHGLPPFRLLVTGTDPLLDDSLAFATRAARSGVAVDLRVRPDGSNFRAEVVSATADYISVHDPEPHVIH